MSYENGRKYDWIVLIISFAFLVLMLYMSFTGRSCQSVKSSSVKQETIGGVLVIGEKETSNDAAK